MEGGIDSIEWQLVKKQIMAGSKDSKLLQVENTVYYGR